MIQSMTWFFGDFTNGKVNLWNQAALPFVVVIIVCVQHSRPNTVDAKDSICIGILPHWCMSSSLHMWHTFGILGIFVADTYMAVAW